MSHSRMRISLGTIESVFDTDSIESLGMSDRELRLLVLDQAYRLSRDLGMILYRVDLIHRDGVNYLDVYQRQGTFKVSRRHLFEG